MNLNSRTDPISPVQYDHEKQAAQLLTYLASPDILNVQQPHSQLSFSSRSPSPEKAENPQPSEPIQKQYGLIAPELQQFQEKWTFDEKQERIRTLKREIRYQHEQKKNNKIKVQELEEQRKKLEDKAEVRRLRKEEKDKLKAEGLAGNLAIGLDKMVKKEMDEEESESSDVEVEEYNLRMEIVKEIDYLKANQDLPDMIIQERMEELHKIETNTQDIIEMQRLFRIRQERSNYLMKQSYYRRQEMQKQHEDRIRQRIQANLEVFDLQQSFNQAQNVYKRGAQLLLNKVYHSRGRQQMSKTSNLHFQGAAQENIPGPLRKQYSKYVGGKAKSQLNSRNLPRQMTKDDLRQGFESAVQASVTSNDFMEINAQGILNEQARVEEIDMKEQLRMAKRLDLKERPKSSSYAGFGRYPRTQFRVGARPETASTHFAKKSPKRVQSGKRSVIRICQSHSNLPPDQRFKRFMQDSNKIHSQLLRSEEQDTQHLATKEQTDSRYNNFIEHVNEAQKQFSGTHVMGGSSQAIGMRQYLQSPPLEGTRSPTSFDSSDNSKPTTSTRPQARPPIPTAFPNSRYLALGKSPYESGYNGPKAIRAQTKLSQEMEMRMMKKREKTRKQLNEAVAQLDFRLKTSSSGLSFAHQPSGKYRIQSREGVPRTAAQSRMKSAQRLNTGSPQKESFEHGFDPQKSRNSPIKRNSNKRSSPSKEGSPPKQQYFSQAPQPQISNFDNMSITRDENISEVKSDFLQSSAEKQYSNQDTDPMMPAGVSPPEISVSRLVTKDLSDIVRIRNREQLNRAYQIAVGGRSPNSSGLFSQGLLSPTQVHYMVDGTLDNMVSVSQQQAADSSMRITSNLTGMLSQNKKNSSTSDNVTSQGPDGSSNITSLDQTGVISSAQGIGSGLLPNSGEVTSPNDKSNDDTQGRNSESQPKEHEGAPKKGQTSKKDKEKKAKKGAKEKEVQKKAEVEEVETPIFLEDMQDIKHQRLIFEDKKTNKRIMRDVPGVRKAGKLVPKAKSKDTFFFAGPKRTPLSVVQLEITGKLPSQSRSMSRKPRMPKRIDWGKDLAEIVEQQDISSNVARKRKDMVRPAHHPSAEPIRESTPLGNDGREGTPDLSISLTGTGAREQEPSEFQKLMMSRPRESESSDHLPKAQQLMVRNQKLRYDRIQKLNQRLHDIAIAQQQDIKNFVQGKKPSSSILQASNWGKSVSQLSDKQKQKLEAKRKKPPQERNLPYAGIKRHEHMFTRLNKDQKVMKPSEEQKVRDEEHFQQLVLQKQRRLYEVADVQAELEELTDDEEEIKLKSPRAYEIWEIKRDIRVAFKRDLRAPYTLLSYYKLGRILGRGSFGKVNLALHKLTRKIVAVKSINKKLWGNGADQSHMKKVENETMILTKMRHKNVIKFFERLEAPNHYLFFMEVAQGGDLLKYIRRRSRLKENTAKFIFKQIIAGLGYIHSKNIIHRDIKLENILIDNEGIIKIADFGISKETKAENDHKLKDRCGTPAYMAPEMITRAVKREGYTAAVDIWAAGVVLYAMVMGHLPFKGKTDDAIFAEISNGNYACRDTASEQCVHLIESILTKDVSQRLKVGQILNHPWITSLDEQNVEVFTEIERKNIGSQFIFQESYDKPDENKPADFSEEDFKSKTQALDDNKLDQWDFEGNTLNSTQEPEMRNLTSKSAVLGPYNSTRSNFDKELVEEIEEEGYEIYNPADILMLNIKVHELNKMYEADNNANVDNGVVNNIQKELKEMDEQEAKKRRKQKELTSLPEAADIPDDKSNPLFKENFQVSNKIVYELDRLGYPAKHVKQNLRENKRNYCTTTYYLMAKNQDVIFGYS